MEAHHNPTEYLSYSRLRRYERCPLSYRLHYIDRAPARPQASWRFGSAVHRVLEKWVAGHVREGHRGRLLAGHAALLWKSAWNEFELSGVSAFREGLRIFERFAEDAGIVAPERVVAVEHRFSIRVRGVEVRGVLDRIDHESPDRFEIIDYKTAAESGLGDDPLRVQLPLYALALRERWPEAKEVKLTSWTLNDGLRRTVTLRDGELGTLEGFVETMAERLSSSQTFSPRIGAACLACDHRHHCSAQTQPEARRSVGDVDETQRPS